MDYKTFHEILTMLWKLGALAVASYYLFFKALKTKDGANSDIEKGWIWLGIAFAMNS